MWTKVKEFFKKTKKPQKRPFTAIEVIMLGQIIDAHLLGRILFKGCATLQDQEKLILSKGGDLKLNNKNVHALARHIKEIKADTILYNKGSNHE